MKKANAHVKNTKEQKWSCKEIAHVPESSCIFTKRKFQYNEKQKPKKCPKEKHLGTPLTESNLFFHK